MNSFDCGDAFHQELEIAAQERFTAGEADLSNPEADGEADRALDFFEAQDAGARNPLLDDGRGVGHVRPMSAIEIPGGFGFRQAIKAAKVAAIGDTDPQITQDAAVRIDEQIGGH